MSRIDTTASRRGARALHGDELDAVAAGVRDSESIGVANGENPTVIFGFNPQPDPPGAPAAMLVR
jgi:hypothetical protein